MGSANTKIRSSIERLLGVKPVTEQSAEAVSYMLPSEQLEDRQKWSRLRAAFSYFPGQWWVGLTGVFSPGEVSLPTGSLFRHSSFLALLQAVCLSIKSSCELSCSEPSYILPRTCSYKMLTEFCGGTTASHRFGPEDISRKGYFGQWLGTAIEVYRWLLIVWYWSPRRIILSSQSTKLVLISTM